MREVATTLSEWRKQLLEGGFKGGLSTDQTSPLELTMAPGFSLAVFLAAMNAVESYHELVAKIEPHVYGQ